MRRLGQLLRELSLCEVYRGHSLQELLVVVWFGLLGELKMSLIFRAEREQTTLLQRKSGQVNCGRAWFSSRTKVL